MLFLYYKAKGNSRHPLFKPGLSKHFFETETKLAMLKQSFSFQKNHDIFNLIMKAVLIKKY